MPTRFIDLSFTKLQYLHISNAQEIEMYNPTNQWTREMCRIVQ